VPAMIASDNENSPGESGQTTGRASRAGVSSSFWALPAARLQFIMD
jgi:hypothetical protein